VMCKNRLSKEVGRGGGNGGRGRGAECKLAKDTRGVLI